MLDIYDNDKILKSHVYLVFLQSPGVYNMFNIIDRDAHSKRRKIIGQVINDRSMRIFEPTMMGQVDIYISLLRASANSRNPEPVNVTNRVRYLALDIIAHLAFGYPLKLQTEDTNRFLVGGMQGANYIANTRMQFYRLHQLKFADVLNALSSRMIERYKVLLEKMIKARTAEDKHARHDLFSVASGANDAAVNPGEEVIRMSDIWSEAITFFPAGAFSSSGAMGAVFFYLSRNPACYEKLADEIRSTFASSEEIRGGPKLTGCQYLRAVIDEAMRLAPPVPGTLWREVPPLDDNGPTVIDGHVVPPGTQVGVNIYSIHHNEDYFPDAFAFKPERWLTSETPEAQRKVMHEAYNPFSIGYRGCAGKPMAYLEMNLVIAKTLWHFDFESAPGKLGEIGAGTPGRTDGRHRPGEYQLYDIIAGAHDGPYLTFRPRDGVRE